MSLSHNQVIITATVLFEVEIADQVAKVTRSYPGVVVKEECHQVSCITAFLQPDIM